MKERSKINQSRTQARNKMNYHAPEKEYCRYTHHTHHKDGNPLNNDIENLEIIPIKEHYKKHKILKDEVIIKDNRPSSFFKGWLGKPIIK